ncbi:MAG: imidazole glycerol phosphate synthase subunit HisF [Candidatus Diapherotrites archaeon]
MLTKRIIPCLDVMNGRVVKGKKFTELIDAGNPVELAKYYNEQGADELSFLDINASYEKRKIMIQTIKEVAEQVFIPLSVGGGIDSIETIRELINAGAEKVSIGTNAVLNPELISKASKKFGSQAIVVSIDAKKTGKEKWNVFIKGGRENTGIDVIEFAKKIEKCRAGEILLNSIDSDGTKKGFDLGLTRKVVQAVNVPVIASGGAGKLNDFKKVFEAGADAALAAGIFHYKKYSIPEVKKFLNEKNIEVRL